MDTRNHIGFEFTDGLVTMHVTVTEYIDDNHSTRAVRLSWHNSMRGIGYTVESFESVKEAVDEAIKIRAQCYADMCGFLQQAM